MGRTDKRKFFKNPWVITIGGTAIGTILASIIWKTNLFIEAFKIIWKFIKLLWKFFTLPVTLPVWALIITILSIPIILLLIVLLTPKKKDEGPSPREYKKDTFDGIVWRWKYEWDSFDKRMEIEELVPFCPQCDCQLRIVGSNNFSCPNCGFENYDFNKSEIDLKILIRHRINQKYFPDQ